MGQWASGRSLHPRALRWCAGRTRIICRRIAWWQCRCPTRLLANGRNSGGPLWRWNPGLQEAERLTLPVTLAALDPSALYERQVEFLSQHGITELATFTPELASGLGLEWTPGVYVRRADPDSPIPSGSIITEVARESVSSREDLYFRLQQAGIPPIFQRVPGSGSQVSLEVISPAGDRELKFLSI